ncbi:hypothetical protein FRC01_002694, partial [Tulasnella sp. 417]
YYMYQPQGPQWGLSAGSTSALSGAPSTDIPIPDLNMDALNTAEASDLFTAPTGAGSSPSSSKPFSSPGSGSGGGSASSKPPRSKRRKESKRPRYDEDIPIPELNMDILNDVEASDLFTAPALSASPPVAGPSSSSHTPPNAASKSKSSKHRKGEDQKTKSKT